MVAIFQSGEMADTLAVLREAKGKNILTPGIVYAGVYNHARPEIGAASTKVFTPQLVVLTPHALFLDRQRNMSFIMGERIYNGGAYCRGTSKDFKISLLAQDSKIKKTARDT